MWVTAPTAMIASGIAAALALLFIDAPYGKFAPDKASYWGPLIPARWAWFIQESPSLVLMLIYWLAIGDSAHTSALPNRVLAAMFCFHYVVRAWIFPFMLNQSKPCPLLVMLMAFGFCVYNGWMQGAFLFTAEETTAARYDKEWLSLPRVQIGIALFIFGWVTNQHADHVLRHLRDKPAPAASSRAADDTAAKARKDGAESGADSNAAKHSGDHHTQGQASDADNNAPHKRYRIPYGGMFRFTSAANYTGEIIEWGGFALAAGSAPAVAFWLFTIFNLAPRAISSHRWYKKNFSNYPKDRKAVIPFIL